MLDVVGDHVRLKKRGRGWEGLCPFHEEKTPSFSVDPDKGLYYCFGCHQGGDVFKFVMQVEHLSFPEAVDRLARRFGVKLPPRSPNLNAYAERFVRSAKSECIGEVIPLGERHLRKVVAEYVEHYHR